MGVAVAAICAMLVFYNKEAQDIFHQGVELAKNETEHVVEKFVDTIQPNRTAADGGEHGEGSGEGADGPGTGPGIIDGTPEVDEPVVEPETQIPPARSPGSGTGSDQAAAGDETGSDQAPSGAKAFIEAVVDWVAHYLLIPMWEKLNFKKIWLDEQAPMTGQ